MDVKEVLLPSIGARREGVARRGQMRAGTTLVARGEFSLIIIGLVGTSMSGRFCAGNVVCVRARDSGAGADPFHGWRTPGDDAGRVTAR